MSHDIHDHHTPTPTTDRSGLSDAHAEVIHATLPLVGSRINDITPVFYKKMFTAHPELIADLFNRGNQQHGDQAKALAASIAVFASVLVDPDKPHPDEMLARIGHKHVSLGITKDQYQIVHDHLFAAIAEVLGSVVTPEVAEAWDAVYWMMADTLVRFEKELYTASGVAAGDVFRDVTVADKKPLSDTVTEFALVGEGLVPPRPGQYTSLGVVLPDGARQLRQYSLLDGAYEQTTSCYRVAVERSGEVSEFLHNHVAVGDTIQATLAAGDLILTDGDNPVVLLSQGIGSTPMVGMLSYLAAQRSQRQVIVVHADASEAESAQKSEMERLVEQLPNARLELYFRDQGERVDAPAIIPAGASVYLCGGVRFLQSVRDQIDAIPADQAPADVHFELFSPNDWLIS